jgi:epidermal growth factor receptor substrate 15
MVRIFCTSFCPLCLNFLRNLADTQDRGALDITDFTIGMYFIQAVMSRQLSVIPLSLPPGLYQQAAGHTQSKGSHVSNNSGSFSPVGSTFSQSKPSSVQPQYTGQNVLQPNYTGISPPKAPSSIPSRPPASPFTASPFGQPAAQNIRWDVSPSEKIVADRYFDDMDVNKRGYVDGDAAVPFMLKSGLGSEDLARIWHVLSEILDIPF